MPPPAGGTTPSTRWLSIVAQDPRVEYRGRILRAVVPVPWERPGPGPCGYRVHVVDYDVSTDTLYRGRRLDTDDDPYEKASDTVLLRDPAFHAQNVYAVVMRTLARFERALGRRVPWGFRSHQLKVVPHAFVEANAFYAKAQEALLFGYFGGRATTVFSCLSHDVVAHESTHALLDGVRPALDRPSSPDQAAFHEGFSDVVAILSIFSLAPVVGALLRGRTGRADSTTIARRLTRRDALQRSSLFRLAEQMGDEMQAVRGHALRESLEIAPSRRLLRTPEYLESHRRGEVLVAAVLQAFLDAWVGRLRRLGEVAPRELDLSRVIEDGAEAADTLLTMAIRALDYLPPVDLEFGDYLSALLTADRESRPDDGKYRYREMLLASCRRYGIDPRSDAPGGYWRPAEEEFDYSGAHLESLQRDPQEMFKFVWDNREALKLNPNAYTRVAYVRPVVRTGEDGFILRETVAEYMQQIELEARELGTLGVEPPRGMPASQEVVLYGGGTLVFDEHGHVKYHVRNRLDDAPRQTARLRYLWEAGLLDPGASRLAGLANLHRRRVLPGPAGPRERW
jgi:hypothetical protein